jgi:hypothetical protein
MHSNVNQSLANVGLQIQQGDNYNDNDLKKIRLKNEKYVKAKY